MVCSSPACPPQATLTDVSEGISDSCVPFAITSGNSPISQFKSILKPPLFILKSNPPKRSVPPAPATVLSPFPNPPAQIESHPAGEAVPGCENPPKSHWQSSDSPQSFAAQQKELWACLPPALESRQARRPRKSSPHPKAPERSRPPIESPCDWTPPLHDTCSHKIIAAPTPETNRSADPASHAKPFEPATPSAPAPTDFVRDLIRSLLQCLAHLLFATLVRRAPRARSS